MMNSVHLLQNTKNGQNAGGQAVAGYLIFYRERE